MMPQNLSSILSLQICFGLSGLGGRIQGSELGIHTQGLEVASVLIGVCVYVCTCE